MENPDRSRHHHPSEEDASVVVESLALPEKVGREYRPSLRNAIRYGLGASGATLVVFGLITGAALASCALVEPESLAQAMENLPTWLSAGGISAVTLAFFGTAYSLAKDYWENSN